MAKIFCLIIGLLTTVSVAGIFYYTDPLDADVQAVAGWGVICGIVILIGIGKKQKTC